MRILRRLVMKELTRTADPVLVSWLEARLREAGIDAVVFDELTSGIYGGAVDAIACRVMVAPAHWQRARTILAEVEGGGNAG